MSISNSVYFTQIVPKYIRLKAYSLYNQHMLELHYEVILNEK